MFHRWAPVRRPASRTTAGATARPCGSARWASPSTRSTRCWSRPRRSAEVTHDHPEGIKGAQAVASAIFLARTGQGKDEIRDYVETTLRLRPRQRRSTRSGRRTQFDVSCQGSVPQAITAFLESDGFEDAVRKAVSLGGDSDTIACIAGGIAQAYLRRRPRADPPARLRGPRRPAGGHDAGVLPEIRVPLKGWAITILPESR